MNNLIICYLILFVTIIQHRAGASQKDGFIRNKRTAEQFPCSAPQPRAINFRDLIDNNEIPPSGRVTPTSTVLYRCASAGCCTSPQEQCTAIAEDDVTLVFGVLGRQIKFIEIQAKNETQCACHNIKDQPK